MYAAKTPEAVAGPVMASVFTLVAAAPVDLVLGDGPHGDDALVALLGGQDHAVEHRPEAVEGARDGAVGDLHGDVRRVAADLRGKRRPDEREVAGDQASGGLHRDVVDPCSRGGCEAAVKDGHISSYGAFAPCSAGSVVAPVTSGVSVIVVSTAPAPASTGTTVAGYSWTEQE